MNSLRDSPEPYLYEPLEDGHIRILHLQPGELGDSLFVEISSEKLDENITEYKALSWQWGHGETIETLRIKNKGNTESKIWTVKVKPNLVAALKRLRKSDEIVRLWVDAICIKQAKENNVEKSDQIAMMTKIYGTAQEVCVWLGEARDDSDKAMKFIDKLVDLEDVNHIAGLERNSFDQSGARQLDYLIKLLKRGWFGRRWVVQEIALARRATVLCGKDSVDWERLADAIALLEKVGRDGTINRIMKKLPATNHASEYAGNISSLPAYRLVQNTTAMFRGQDKRGIQTWSRTLEELVSYLAAFRASRLHDTIYALLGLSSDVEPIRTSRSTSVANSNAHPKRGLRKAPTTMEWGPVTKTFEVNYETPPLVVFKKFLKLAIEGSESLDIICRPWAPETGRDADDNVQTIELPSWIPSLSRKPFQPTKHGNMVRYNPDPLVGPAGYKTYRASGLAKPDLEIVALGDGNSKRMRVKGFRLGEIGETWNSGEFGNVPAEWLKAGGWEDDNKRPPDELWRTLVADRNAQGDEPDRLYPMVLQEAVKERGIHYGFETHKLIHESTNSTVSELFRRVQAVVWNRRLISVKGGFVSWLMSQSKVSRQSMEASSVTKNASLAVGIDDGNDENDENDESDDSSKDAVEGANGHAKTRITGQMKDGLEEQDGSQMNEEDEDEDVDWEEESQEPEPKALGLAPNGARKGDLICILLGCSVPLVLRQILGSKTTSKRKTMDEPEIYTLIGECYIGHMMDGGAMTYLESQHIRTEHFELE